MASQGQVAACWKSSKGMDVYSRGIKDFDKPDFALMEAKSCRIRGLSPALRPCRDLSAQAMWEHNYSEGLETQNLFVLAIVLSAEQQNNKFT